MQKLCEIEEKLKKEHIDIKSRYVKLKLMVKNKFVLYSMISLKIIII